MLRLLGAVWRNLQHKPRQILACCRFGKLIVHIRHIKRHRFAAAACRVERQVFKKLFHHRVQASCANVFSTLVDFKGKLSQACDPLVGKVKMYVFGREQGTVLFGQRGVGIAQNANKIFRCQLIKLDANGKTPL